MARCINKITLLGNVGRDPDVQTTAAGTKVAHLSIATSRRVPRNGGFEERTEWHRLTLWDRLAQLAEDYIRKGDRLYVEGRIEYDSFERNGETIPTAEITVREVVLLGSPRECGFRRRRRRGRCRSEASPRGAGERRPHISP